MDLSFYKNILVGPLPVEGHLVTINRRTRPVEYAIYTDGYGLDGWVGFSFYMFLWGTLVHYEVYQLNPCHMVLSKTYPYFLCDLVSYVNWSLFPMFILVDQDKHIWIYTDSMSSIQVLGGHPRINHLWFKRVKCYLSNYRESLGSLGWMPTLVSLAGDRWSICEGDCVLWYPHGGSPSTFIFSQRLETTFAYFVFRFKFFFCDG